MPTAETPVSHDSLANLVEAVSQRLLVLTDGEHRAYVGSELPAVALARRKPILNRIDKVRRRQRMVRVVVSEVFTRFFRMPVGGRRTR